MKAQTFTVTYRGIKLLVTLRENVLEVGKAYRACNNGRSTLRRGEQVRAFFWPTLSLHAQHVGGIVLPRDGEDLNELIPHEVAHAVIHAHQGVLPHDDEATATAIGVLCTRIFKRINKIRAEAQ